MYFGADYYPEHWPEERWEQDARLMQEAGLNVIRMAEFAWTYMEPREGEFNFGWLDRAIALFGSYGIRSVLGTPTAAPPAWIMAAHPDAALVREDGVRVTYGSRRTYCPNHGEYRRHSARIVRAMAEHFAGNPNVIGWQIDNEFGGRCYCPTCQAAFQEWLKNRYGTLEALNEAWGTVFWSHIYTAWEQIPLPWSTTGIHNPGLALNYRRFMSDSYVDYQRQQLEIIRAADPGVPITHNLMGFGYPNLNYFDLAADLDWVSWDNYPRFMGQPDAARRALAHDTMRGLKGKPFWVMEEQAGPTGQNTVAMAPRPGEIPFWSWEAIAHGADGIVFFRWRTARFGGEEYWHGILDHHGIPGRRYNEVKEMGAVIRRLGDRLVGSAPRSQVAMLLSYDSRFALQNQPHNRYLDYPQAFMALYRGLRTLNAGIDIVSPSASLDGYSVVVAPMLYILEPQLAEKLTAYVRAGGTLVVTARSGVMDVDNTVVEDWLPGLLREVCGVTVQEYDSLDDGRSVPVEGSSVCSVPAGNATAWADVLALEGAEAMARFAGEYYAGKPTITRNRFGKGQAIYLATVPDEGLAESLASWLGRETGLSSPVPAEAGLEVLERVTQGGSYLFLLNNSARALSADIGKGGLEYVTENRLSGIISVPPMGVRIIAREE
ncbi:MAG: beta-galactosidase [Anaerolineae bacterium]|jgi:beta-galactosidase|nr:beta-galactosidase [Chloroflexota bacterium]